MREAHPARIDVPTVPVAVPTRNSIRHGRGIAEIAQIAPVDLGLQRRTYCRCGSEIHIRHPHRDHVGVVSATHLRHMVVFRRMGVPKGDLGVEIKVHACLPL